MTNYEKNKELLDMYAVANVSWGVDADGKVFECDFCNNCIFREKGHCTQSRLNWLQQEYKESEVEVDWSKVPIDTPILVRNDESVQWHERYFAGYYNGEVLSFNHNATSNNYHHMISWKYAKLAEQEIET